MAWVRLSLRLLAYLRCRIPAAASLNSNIFVSGMSFMIAHLDTETQSRDCGFQLNDKFALSCWIADIAGPGVKAHFVPALSLTMTTPLTRPFFSLAFLATVWRGPDNHFHRLGASRSPLPSAGAGHVWMCGCSCKTTFNSDLCTAILPL
jgi:hypothetical protein